MLRTEKIMLPTIDRDFYNTGINKADLRMMGDVALCHI